jgi:hypothetical protein
MEHLERRPANAGAPGGALDDLRAAVGEAQRQLSQIYRIELAARVEQFVVDSELATELLPRDPRGHPRSGLLMLEEADVAWIGLYVDPSDYRDPATIIEETSHWFCVAWHAAQDRSVSLLGLELQAEIDRFAIERVEGRGGLEHLGDVEWDSWMDAAARERYRAAHDAAGRYCRRLLGRYPDRADTPGLLGELRHFYRAPLVEKLALVA